MRYRALLLAIVMSGGCSVGEVEGLTSDANPDDPAALSFNSMIKPIVTPRCTATCHSPGKTQPTPALDAYANLQPNYKVAPAANVLLTHLPDGAPHQTTTFFSTSEKAIVSAWLNTLP